MSRSRRLRPVAALLCAGALLAGCTGETTGAGRSAGVLPESPTPGGTLTALALGPVLAWDPQRIGSRDDMAFAGRVFLRTLTAYAPAGPQGGRPRLVGDLATDTGTHDASLTTWSFTLRDGVKWQDGSDVTCEDVRYGISRTFATATVTGGATDALAVLNVPRHLDGTSTYLGPYDTSPKGAAGRTAYAKAVTCSGRTVTFVLSVPTADFDEMVSYPAWAPVRKDQDSAGGDPYAVFSCGPYMLASAWQASAGGTFVRNPHWDRGSDPLRGAYPDQIVYREGVETATAAQQIISDDPVGRAAVSLQSVPPVLQQHVTSAPALRDRSVNPPTGLVEYLVPNVRGKVFGNALARQALAQATNRDAYLTAVGGGSAAAPSLLTAVVRSHPATATPFDPQAARATLVRSKLTLPVRITVAYRSSDPADKGMAALVAGWERAGFAPTLKPVAGDYFATLGSPAAQTLGDVYWSIWAPAWASPSTVLPPLFDGALNLSPSGPGRDYGWFADPAIDTRMSAANRLADPAERAAAWAQVDDDLRAGGVYVPLLERRALYIAGSDVVGLSANEALGGAVDLADVAVRS